MRCAYCEVNGYRFTTAEYELQKAMLMGFAREKTWQTRRELAAELICSTAVIGRRMTRIRETRQLASCHALRAALVLEHEKGLWSA